MDPVRNIRLIMPGFLATHEAQPFHPFFLKHIERFSTLRFMDWQHTNSDDWVTFAPATHRCVRVEALRGATLKLCATQY
jgi:hypothetical protein